MELIQQDKEGAFQELYRRYGTPIYNYFMRLIGPVIAEDLMQDTFIKVLSKRMTFRFESKVKTWIWIIAKNTLRDHWRSQEFKMKNSFETLFSDHGEEVLESPMDSSEMMIMNKLTKEQLISCIDYLPAEQREVVLLHIHSELSNQEIAELTGFSLGAIKSILFRSKEKLIECFKRGGICE